MATPEQKTQLATCEWLTKQYPEIAQHVVKIDNEGKRTVGMHMLNLRMGLHKGASDLFIAWVTEHYPGCWIEIKPDGWKGPHGKKAKLHHENQMNFIAKMKKQGYFAQMCVGVDECIAAIKTFLKGK